MREQKTKNSHNNPELEKALIKDFYKVVIIETGYYEQTDRQINYELELRSQEETHRYMKT